MASSAQVFLFFFLPPCDVHSPPKKSQEKQVKCEAFKKERERREEKGKNRAIDFVGAGSRGSRESGQPLAASAAATAAVSSVQDRN